MKKFLSMFLTITLIACIVFTGMFTTSVSAATEYTEGYYTYTVEDKKATITNFDKSIGGNITIPSRLGGYPVVTIGGWSFEFCEGITGVTIPDSVTSIEMSAFYGCYRLATIHIPDSVTSIDGSVFIDTLYYTNKANWEDGVLYIGKHLVNTDEKEVSGEYVVKEGTKTIAGYAFSSCELLTNIIIPNSVISIGEGAFSLCDRLINIIIPDSITHIQRGMFINSQNLKSITIPKSVKKIDSDVLGGCNNFKEVYYMGSESEKLDISMSIDNRELYEATWYYNCCINARLHTYDNNDDATCNVCGFVRKTVWKVYPDATGVYSLLPSKTLSGFNNDSITVYDKNGGTVKYSDSKKGWALVKNQEYAVSFNKDYANINDLTWQLLLLRKSDPIFPDTNMGDWYYDAVTYAVGSGIMSGYASNGKFGTSDSIQRQDFVVMLARLDGVDLENYNYKSKFSDVARNSYYEAAVNWGEKTGIVKGYSHNGKFGVGDPITREQIVTFLYRYAKYKGYDTGYTSDRENTVSTQYTDYKMVSQPEFKQAILWAIEKGAIKGKTDTTIVPQGNAQRCEMAQIMYNIFLNSIFN